jgi:hypothetical protein
MKIIARKPMLLCRSSALAGILWVATLPVTAQNVVTDWNAIAITQARASTAPGATGAGSAGVYVTYAELAVYNALVAIEGKYQPYKYKLTAPAGASPDAAAIEAAYQVLLVLLPDRTEQLTSSYNLSMAAIPDSSAKYDGQSVGRASASRLLALRSGDGLGVPWPYSYPSSPVPGVWILTPGATAPATPWLGQMTPFTFDDPGRYLPDEPPPSLNSWTWIHDYNETKALGAVDSTVRTPEQTEIGRFWTDNTTAQYGGMLRLLAMQENLSPLETSRLLAMTYASMADGVIGCFNAKYHFSFWRPVTAIQNGDIDGNPRTVADPSWAPLGVTPAHPEYPAAHGCITGALADSLQAYFGTPKIFISVSSAVTGTTHHFTNVHDLENEVEGARIYAGFHYRHSVDQGLLLGHRVARHVTSEYFERSERERK